MTCWLVRLEEDLLPVSITHGNGGGSVDASSFGANHVNDLYCLAFKVTEENRSKEAFQECKQSHFRLQAVSTHCRNFLPGIPLAAWTHTQTHTERSDFLFAIELKLKKIDLHYLGNHPLVFHSSSQFLNSSIKTPDTANVSLINIFSALKLT